MRSLVLPALLLLSASSAQAQEPRILPKQSGWVGAVAFAPNSRTLAIGTGDGGVALWDATTGKMLRKLNSHKHAVAALAWLLDHAMLISSGHDHIVIYHSIKPRSGLTDTQTGHTGAVMSAVVTPKGERLFTGSADATIREWDTSGGTKTVVHRDHTSWVNGLAIDRDGKMLASAGSDNAVIVRNLGDMSTLAKFTVRDGEVRSVAFSPDGKQVAGGIRYGGVRVWDLESSKEVAALKAHVGETWAVAYTPDGKTLASGGGDWNKPGEVRLWDTATWKERATLKHSGEVLCLSISPNGKLLAAGGWDRMVRVWELAK